jgi:hypothetical protein
MPEPPVHPDVEHLAFLLGTWVGEGVGDYPTIEHFGYREQTRFTHEGKPVIAYAQRTWSLDEGAPMHSETGYWRGSGDGGVEVVLAHPFGIVEIQEGSLEGGSVVLRSKTLASTSTADEIVAVARAIEVDGDVMRYTVDMAAAGMPLQRHLEAELKRTET